MTKKTQMRDEIVDHSFFGFDFPVWFLSSLVSCVVSKHKSFLPFLFERRNGRMVLWIHDKRIRDVSSLKTIRGA